MLDPRDSVTPSTPLSVDPSLLDESSDADLDLLPFGVIGLDPDGTILRYNQYEARLARLDRNQVIGRRFFTDVAPCTGGEAFEGRFRKAVENGSFGSLDRFPFVFDFRFGAQEVAIEIVRPQNARGRYYLLINRVRTLAPRPEFPKELLAKAQADLAPGEAQSGVRRDEVERRIVELPANVLSALRATFDKVAPETFQLFCAEWGVQWGRRAAVDLETFALEQKNLSLRELPMRAVAAMVSDVFARQGWGLTTIDFSHMGSGLVAIELSRSAIAESMGASTKQGQLVCALLAGCYGAILSHVAGRRLAAREVACRAGGAERCSFLVIAHAKRGEIDKILVTGARGVTAVREALNKGAGIDADLTPSGEFLSTL